jgi:hypothetical protein
MPLTPDVIVASLLPFHAFLPFVDGLLPSSLNCSEHVFSLVALSLLRFNLHLDEFILCLLLKLNHIFLNLFGSSPLLLQFSYSYSLVIFKMRNNETSHHERLYHDCIAVIRVLIYSDVIGCLIVLTILSQRRE